MSRIRETGGTGEEVREAASSIGEKVRDMGSQVRDVAQERWHQLRDTAGNYYEQGRDKAVQLEENVENYIQGAPIKSVLIACGVGLLLGILWKRS